jgi:hypothetical protein
MNFISACIFRGEAPPPYEEAIATTGVPNSFLTVNGNNRVNTTILTNENINQLQLTSTTAAEPSAPPQETETAGSTADMSAAGSNSDQRQPTAGPSRPSPPSTLAVQTVAASTNDATLPPYDTVAFSRGRDCFRHSLTLPRRPTLTFDEIREFGLVLDGANNNYFRRNRQRFSLQLNVNVDDSSSSSSTVSMSPSITPIDHRNHTPSSSSSSSNFP